jgi:hypothetical protein
MLTVPGDSLFEGRVLLQDVIPMPVGVHRGLVARQPRPPPGEPIVRDDTLSLGGSHVAGFRVSPRRGVAQRGASFASLPRHLAVERRLLHSHGVVRIIGPCLSCALLLACGSSDAVTTDGSVPFDGASEAGLAAADVTLDMVATDMTAPIACETHSVRFRLETQTEEAGTSNYCTDVLSNDCSRSWVSIRSNDNGDLAIYDPCPCVAGVCFGCDGCGPGRVPLGEAGSEFDWDGTYYTCADPSPTCLAKLCAAPGQYVARFCVYEEPAGPSGEDCTGAATLRCTQAPFVWPPTDAGSTVLGFLGPDASSCCPTGWNLSECTYPDGGTWEQCSNPAPGSCLAACESQRCGAVVTGGCDGG